MSLLFGSAIGSNLHLQCSYVEFQFLTATTHSIPCRSTCRPLALSLLSTPLPVIELPRLSCLLPGTDSQEAPPMCTPLPGADLLSTSSEPDCLHIVTADLVSFTPVWTATEFSIVRIASWSTVWMTTPVSSRFAGTVGKHTLRL